MKTTLTILAVAILVTLTPNTCFALWDIETVSMKRAKELGMEVRSSAVGPILVQVELDFKAAGELKNFRGVDLRRARESNKAMTEPLQEDRSKPGRIAVRFTADRAQLDKLTLWVRVRGELGGSIYELRVKDFVERKKAP
jgi:hypothetical protein